LKDYIGRETEKGLFQKKRQEAHSSSLSAQPNPPLFGNFFFIIITIVVVTPDQIGKQKDTISGALETKRDKEGRG
jgi:hypothetical protein